MLSILVKLKNILPSKMKWDLTKVGVLILLSGVVETFSISLIVPFMSLLVEPNALDKFVLLVFIKEIFPAFSNKEFIALAGTLLIIAFMIKNAFLAFVLYVQSAVLNKGRYQIARGLFRFYLQKPYSFHLANNSAKLIKNIQTEVGILFGSAIMAVIVIATEVFVVSCIIIYLLWLEPQIALISAGVLSVGGAIFYGLIRNRALELGFQRQSAVTAFVKVLQQSFHGVKQIKISDSTRFMVDCLHAEGKRLTQVGRWLDFVSGVPRLVNEIIIFLCMVVITLFSLFESESIVSVVPTLSLFGMAAFRMLPAANKIMTQLPRLKTSIPTLDVVFALTNKPEIRDTIMLETIEPLHSILPLRMKSEISLQNISFSYDKSETLALSNITLSIKKGERIGIVGPSGSGKSTLVDIILGLLEPDSGNLFVDEYDIRKHIAEWQKNIGYVPQDIYLLDDTLRKNIAFGVDDDKINDDAIIKSTCLAHLETVIDNLPKGLETIIGERGVRLSGGQRQRVGIARALYHDQQILLLDEATSSLDITMENEMAKMLNTISNKKTIITVAHRLNTIKNSDRLYFLNHGKIEASGTYDELYQSCSRFKEMVDLSESGYTNI